jgi:hypothetical protein
MRITVAVILAGLFLGVACISRKSGECAALTWENAMQTALARSESGDYRFIIDHLLAPEELERAAREFSDADGWERKYIERHLRHLPYYFGWLRDCKIEHKGDAVHLSGAHGAFAVFRQRDGRWYLLEFGQHIFSM